MEQAMLQHGAFSWNELMTTDVASAKAFYGELFGWEMKDEQMPDMTYTMLRAGDREVGGMMAMPVEAQGTPPAWGAYVTVNDIDATAKRVEELGGKIITPPRDIPQVGRFCVFQDPQGAFISAITYRME